MRRGEIPVIAAGGIGDAENSSGIYVRCCWRAVSTRFLVAHECTIHRNYKERVLKAKDIDTITTGEALGAPCPCVKIAFHA